MTITQAELDESGRRTVQTAHTAAVTLRAGPLGRRPNTCVTTDGAHITITVAVLRPRLLSTRTVYLHAIPWARGWSIFASYAPTAGQGDWKVQPWDLRGLQRPLYVPRGKTGAYHVPADALAAALADLADHLIRLDTASRARIARRHWYWPTAVLARAYCNE